MKTMHNKRLLGLALSTALTSVALSGCTTSDASRSAHSASAAPAQYSHGIASAEAAIAASPRNADYRALAASAYLEAGRFASAEQAYAEAIELGDNSARTALSHALAAIGAGRQDVALATLARWDGAMDAGDYGLALALAGRPQQGAHVLGNAIRQGQNTAKVRQNLAYAMALAGDWRAARVMAAEDVPADQLGARLGDWASTSAPEFYQVRVANLLGVPIVADAGMPTHLALANTPESQVQLAAADDFDTAFEAEESDSDAVALAAYETPSDPVQTVALASDGVRYISRAVIQQIPARSEAQAAPVRVAKAEARPAQVSRAKPATKAPAKLVSGDHRIQLGSFLDEAQAERAKTVYAKKYPQLDSGSFQVARAQVNGKTYYRVSAGGMARASARSMCSTIRAKGEGCMAYAGSTSLPGTSNKDVRVAAR